VRVSGVDQLDVGRRHDQRPHLDGVDDQPRAIVRLDLHHVAPVAMNSARRARPMAVSAAWWIAPGRLASSALASRSTANRALQALSLA
jgi:hypothetical protein